MRRVVYRGADGKKRVAIITPDGVVHAAKEYRHLSADQISKMACEESTGQVVKVTKFTRYDPEWGQDRLVYERQEIERSTPPEDILKATTAVAAQWLAKQIEGGMSPAMVAKLSAEAADLIGELVAKRVATFIPEETVKGVGYEEATGQDEHLDGNKREKEKSSPIGAVEGVPHLDGDKERMKTPFNAPAVVSEAPSKSLVKILKATGYESIGTDDQGIEHLINEHFKSEALIHPTDGFALRSGYTGSVCAGITERDLLDALDEQ